MKNAMLQAIRSLASEPGLSSSTENPVVQLDELSIACTNEICDTILALYDTEELERTGGDKTLGKSLRVLMKNMEEVVSSSKSSSWDTVSENSSTMPPGATEPSSGASTASAASAASAAQSESSFSEEFTNKASEAISELLLKTELKLTPMVPPPPADPVGSETEVEQLIEQAKVTARQILQNFFMIVQSLQEHLTEVNGSVQAGLERGQRLITYVRKIHMDIHNLVSSFICERKQNISLKSEMLMDVYGETDPTLCGSSKNIEESIAAKFLDKATQATSSILLNRLSSRISTGMISERSWVSRTKLPSMALSPQDSVSKCNIDTEQELNDEVGEAQLNDAVAPPSYPEAQTSSFFPLHHFTVMRKYLKTFLMSVQKNVDGPARSESQEDFITPIHISEDGTIYELTEPTLSHSLSDSVLDRKNKMLNTMQLPPKLIFRFVDFSTKALMENVLNISSPTVKSSKWSTEPLEQEVEYRQRLRFIMKRQLVIKPRFSRKRIRVPQPTLINLVPSIPSNVNYDSPRQLRKFFRNARKQVGRVFSGIGRNFTKLLRCHRDS